MSEAEKDQLAELKQEILAKIGAGVLAILSTVILITIGAATQWFAALNRIDKLETWKTERASVIDGSAERLARIEETLKNYSGRLDAIQTAILSLKR